MMTARGTLEEVFPSASAGVFKGAAGLGLVVAMTGVFERISEEFSVPGEGVVLMETLVEVKGPDTQLPAEPPPQPLRDWPAGHPPHVLQLTDPALSLYCPEGQDTQLPAEPPPHPLRD